MKSKHIFKQFGKKLDKETKQFKAHSEKADVSLRNCNHKGKVKMIGDELRCNCGVGWRGSNVGKLFDLLNSK